MASLLVMAMPPVTPAIGGLPDGLRVPLGLRLGARIAKLKALVFCLLFRALARAAFVAIKGPAARRRSASMEV